MGAQDSAQWRENCTRRTLRSHETKGPAPWRTSGSNIAEAFSNQTRATSDLSITNCRYRTICTAPSIPSHPRVKIDRKMYSREDRELVTEGVWWIEPRALRHANPHAGPCRVHGYRRRTVLARCKRDTARKAKAKRVRGEVVSGVWGEHGGTGTTCRAAPSRRLWAGW